jgi:hypothetical protein
MVFKYDYKIKSGRDVAKPNKTESTKKKSVLFGLLEGKVHFEII